MTDKNRRERKPSQWGGASPVPGGLLAAMDPDTVHRVPRWLARQRWPLVEGVTMPDRGRDLTQLVVRPVNGERR